MHEHVVIIEASPSVVAQLPERAREIIKNRLVDLGIGVYDNTRVISYDGHILKTSTGDFSSRSVIWAAGLAAHPLLKEVHGEYDKKGRIMVNQYLETTVDENIFAIGDSASTMRSGLAQTAIYDGEFVANSIIKKFKNKKRKEYNPPFVGYAVPVGPYWGIASFGKKIIVRGLLGHIFRNTIDFWYLFTHLHARAAVRVFFNSRGK